MNAIGEWINANLSGPLAILFAPTNMALSAVDSPGVAKFCALSMFLVAMVAVFMLKKEYVNMSAPRQNIFFDLRFWTIAAMAPHVIIYLWLGT